MELFQHNQEIFDKYVSMRENHKNILVIEGTGLGKTNIAIKVIDSYFRTKRVLYVVPKNLLKDEVKRNKYFKYPFVEFICYNSLHKYDAKDYSLCIFDEAHRAGAPKWMKQAKRFIDSISCNVLALTATNIRMDGLNIEKELFNGKGIIHGLSVFDAIDRGLLPKPNYISAILEPDIMVKNIEETVSKTKFYNKEDKDKIEEKLNVIKTSYKNELEMENIIYKHTNGTNKFIVFIPKIPDCERYIPIFKKILKTNKVYTIHSKKEKDYNKSTVEYFNSYKGKDNIALLGVNMLSEGLHIEGVSQIIMLRGTKSNPMYLQMFGRVLRCDNKDYTPVIFDLIENYKNMKPIFEHLPPEEVYDKDGVLISKKTRHFTNYVNIIGDYVHDFNDIAEIFRNNKIIWTDEMMEDIMNPNMDSVSISKKYNIAYNTVNNKRKSLGLNYGRHVSKIIWSDEIISDLCNPELDSKYISKKYNIKYSTIVRKRKSLGYSSNKQIIWSDNMIEDLYSNKSSYKIAKKYNISQNTVVAKRHSLGIDKNRSIIWTDDIIKLLYNTSLTNVEISNITGINAHSIGDKRKKLNIISDNMSETIWTDEMIKMLYIYSADYLSNIWNIPKFRIRKKRKELNILDRHTIVKKILDSEECLTDIKNLNLSCLDISKKYNIPANAVSRYRKNMNIPIIRISKIIWSDEIISDLCNPELSSNLISKKYGISVSSILKKRKELGIISKYSHNKQKTVEGN